MAWRCLWCRWGGEEGWAIVFQRAASYFNGLRHLFHVPPTYRLLWQLKKALPAVSLSMTDLCSLCSKITAQPSTAVLMHMKQNSWMVQTNRTQECTCTLAWAEQKAGADICGTNMSELICDSSPQSQLHLQFYVSKLCKGIKNHKKVITEFLIKLND